jgi:hypothetical protein
MMEQFKSLPATTRKSARSAYRTAMNHPKTSTAVILGTGLAAALLWLSKRNGGFSGLHQEILRRVRN